MGMVVFCAGLAGAVCFQLCTARIFTIVYSCTVRYHTQGTSSTVR